MAPQGQISRSFLRSQVSNLESKKGASGGTRRIGKQNTEPGGTATTPRKRDMATGAWRAGGFEGAVNITQKP